jgi:hypothetical protein
MDKFEYLWDKQKHEDTLFSNRANFFLVAHALLFTSIATLQNGFEMKIIISILGILIAIIWLYCSKRNLSTQNKIKKELKILEKPAEITESEPECLGTHILMGIVMPLIFLIAWILIFYFQYQALCITITYKCT